MKQAGPKKSGISLLAHIHRSFGCIDNFDSWLFIYCHMLYKNSWDFLHLWELLDKQCASRVQQIQLNAGYARLISDWNVYGRVHTMHFVAVV
jgi:hypothetical protein